MVLYYNLNQPFWNIIYLYFSSLETQSQHANQLTSTDVVLAKILLSDPEVLVGTMEENLVHEHCAGYFDLLLSGYPNLIYQFVVDKIRHQYFHCCFEEYPINIK